MKTKEIMCGYCGGKINPNNAHGLLASGILLHDNCYDKAFTGKDLKSKLFRFKNDFLAKISYFGCLIEYLKWERKNK